MPLTRLALTASLVLALTACGGGGLGSVLGPNPINNVQCNPGTQVQLANPLPGQTGVSTNTSQITIVANGSNNFLYNSYSQWNVTLVPQYGGGPPIQGGPLSLVPDPNGPHPFSSDFYYNSNVGSLPSGVTWDVQLSEQFGNCLPVPLNTFST
ncbi:MAG TPA: hypothetical protein VKT72_05605 [Candidatus Baltobacteraceae bacterium]|nr:hypothetical protein [Candidatus Baltobacteraceae bacterium]